MMKPTIQIPLLVSAAVSTQVLALDGTDTTTTGELTTTEFTIEIADPSGAEHNHWRVDASKNLSSWLAFSTTEVLHGTGTATIAFPDNIRPRSIFFRTTVDNTSANVLDLPDPLPNYADINLPPHLITPQEIASDNTPEDNPVTDTGATLGRVLFYDTKLSANYSVSCASCHQQSSGFTDPDQFSTGFEGGLTGRNSMGLSNAKLYASGHFFWDERADTLEDQVLGPIQDDVEMGMTLTALTERLERYDYYADLFTAAYGDDGITPERISLALAQFVRSMLTYQSKFDEGIATEFANFTQSENRGRRLFNSRRAACAACHSGPNFVGNRIDNNGLEFPYLDRGAGAVTGRPQDEGKFKMSSLRNIEVTGPYMHDGRFDTLEEVIDHYSTGVVDNPNLGRQLRTPGAPGQPPTVNRPNFTDQEKADLVAFLKTLTDIDFLTDPKYASPFRNE